MLKFLRANAKFVAFACVAQVPISWLFGDFWLVDATKHFLPQQIVLFALAMALWFPGYEGIVKWLGISAFGTLMLVTPHLFTVLFRHEFTFEFEPRPADFKLITFNVLTSNTLKEDAAKWIRDSLAADTPNVVVTLETNRAWIAELDRALHDKLPYSYQNSRSDNFGMAVFSSVPFESVELDALEFICGVPQFKGVAKISGRSFKLIGVHAVPPAPGSIEFRDRCLDAIDKEAYESKLPVLVTGDFNCSPWAGCFPPSLKDPFPYLLRPHTWSTLGGLVSTTLDHMLYTGGIEIGEPKVGPDLGSDHRPISGHVWFR